MQNNFSPQDDRLTDANSAADLIRQKLQSIYNDEPDAREELQESQAISGPRSKHQQFMYELGSSGRSLAEIQTAWHTYYVNLPDEEKHAVWQEFYEEHNRRERQWPAAPTETQVPNPSIQPPAAIPTDPRSISDIKGQLVGHVEARGRVRRSGHFKSLMFGLSCGAVTVMVLLFGFFNERFIAPFITPSKSVSNSAIIIDPNSTDVGPESKIIIPKINAEIPIIFDEPSINEDAIQSALERGVVHYPNTSSPGETGNGVIFGHSSNNILNRGQYKFAFVLLKRLEAGDTFIVQKDSKRYVYRVFDKKVVSPKEVGVLDDTLGKSSTFSLITCDPPGTTINRLVVTGEQITPDPSSNVASTAKPVAQDTPSILPGNSESLWHRLTSWLRS